MWFCCHLWNIWNRAARWLFMSSWFWSHKSRIFVGAMALVETWWPTQHESCAVGGRQVCACLLNSVASPANHDGKPLIVSGVVLSGREPLISVDNKANGEPTSQQMNNPLFVEGFRIGSSGSAFDRKVACPLMFFWPWSVWVRKETVGKQIQWI